MSIEEYMDKIRQYPEVWSVSLTRFNSGLILFWAAEVRFMDNTRVIIEGGSPELILETLDNRVRGEK
jgi:hypothetical protein